MSSVTAARPDATEYAPFYAGYIDLVPQGDIVMTLERQMNETREFLNGLTPSRASHRYAADKWSIKEIVGHLADSERVFSYRALRISRGDKTELPGFDQNDYVRAGRFDDRELRDLAAEFELVRRAGIALLEPLSDREWTRTGSANGSVVSVRAIAFMIAGHELHHLKVIRERYL